MDFSLGLGYIHADYDKYVVINGVRVSARQRNKELVGPRLGGCHPGVEHLLAETEEQ